MVVSVHVTASGVNLSSNTFISLLLNATYVS